MKPASLSPARRAPLAPALRVAAVVLLAALGLAAGTVAGTDGMQKLALVGAALLVYVALFIWQPEIALLTYIALRPLVDAFVRQGVGGYTLGVLWGFGLIVSAFLFFVIQARDREEPLKFAAVPLAFLFLLAVLTLVRPGLGAAVAGWTRVATWIIVLMVCERISRDRRGQQRCFNAAAAMVLTLLLAVGVMVAQGRFGAQYYLSDVRHVSGQLPHPLAVGAVLLLPVALTAMLFVRPRWLALVGGLALCAAIVVSYVRTAYIGAAVVLAAFVAAAIWGRGGARIAALVVIAVAAAMVWIVRASITYRLSDLTVLSSSGAARGGAGNGRVEIWTTAVHKAFDTLPHALLGRGADAPAKVMMSTLTLNVGAQNDFLDFVLIGGLVLGVCYLVVLVWMTLSPLAVLRDPAQSSPAKAYATLVLGAMAAFVVMSMINGIATYQPVIAAGILVGLVRGMARTPGDTFLDEPPADGAEA